MPDIYVSPNKKKGKRSSMRGKSAKRKKKKKTVKSAKPAGRQETVADRLEKERVDGKVKAYLVRPRKIKFETQDKKEKIVIMLRRHLVTQIGAILLIIIMLLAPLILKIVPLLEFLPARFKLITILMWYLLVVAFIFEKFLGWFFNVNIITDERIIDIDFYSLGYKEVSEAKIDRVQDIGYVTGGALRSIFNFGNVLIQTAGEKPQLIFEDVPNPQVVAKILNELILEEEKEKIEGKTK